MSEWISVKERLPEHLQEVLTVDQHGNFHLFTHFKGSLFPFNIDPDHPRFYMPTHWMPLPEPPGEEGE